MKLINGDITEMNEGLIIHQVNCVNAMGAGVALALARKWPEVKSQYHEYNENLSPEELFGRLDEVVIDDKLSVFNSYSQLTVGTHKKQTDENILIDNIRKASEIAKSRNTLLFIPYLIGCGLGGGDWGVISSALEEMDNVVIVKLKQK